MNAFFRGLVSNVASKLVQLSIRQDDPSSEFQSWPTIRLNQRRLEHLASLNLDLPGHSVLEVGAGIGNLTDFFIDRGCKVLSTEGRAENLKVLALRHPGIQTQQIDLENPTAQFESPFDLVFCYGLLYHLNYPDKAIAFMAQSCRRFLILETCVSFGDNAAVNLCTEDRTVVSQALSGTGCRPTRRWVFEEMKKKFAFVYMPKTQPYHAHFPLDWRAADKHGAAYSRAVFIGSHQEIDNPLLLTEIPTVQARH